MKNRRFYFSNTHFLTLLVLVLIHNTYDASLVSWYGRPIHNLVRVFRLDFTGCCRILHLPMSIRLTFYLHKRSLCNLLRQRLIKWGYNLINLKNKKSKQSLIANINYHTKSLATKISLYQTVRRNRQSMDSFCVLFPLRINLTLWIKKGLISLTFQPINLIVNWIQKHSAVILVDIESKLKWKIRTLREKNAKNFLNLQPSRWINL